MKKRTKLLLAALSLAGLLVVSFAGVALAMMVTVAISGVFGKYFARTETIRRYWRAFHVPYTILFFVVLLLHVLMKVHVFGGD